MTQRYALFFDIDGTLVSFQTHEIPPSTILALTQAKANDSHYFDVLLDECRKVYPFGGRRSVLDGYKSVYTNKLEAIYGADIHFWYGTKETFVAKPQAEHLLRLCPSAHVEVFKGMNHGQLLVDHPDEVARRIILTHS